MAANPTMPNTFTNGTAADAPQVNANFAVLTAWIAANAMQVDGTVAFSAVPSGPAVDPTTVNQLTRKAYVDARDTRLARVRLYKSQTFGTSWANISAWTEQEDVGGCYSGVSSYAIIPVTGTYVVNVSCVANGTNVGTFSTQVTIEGITNGTPNASSNSGPAYSQATLVYLVAGNTVGVQGILSSASDTAKAQEVTLIVTRVS